MKEIIDQLASEFSNSSHGSSEYFKDEVFIRGKNDEEFVPISFAIKKEPSIKNINSLQESGYVFSSLNYLELSSFDKWFQKSFNKKLSAKKLIDFFTLLNLPSIITLSA